MAQEAAATRIVMNGTRKLPEGWGWVPLGSFLKLEYGKALPARERDVGGDYPVYGSGGQIGVHGAALTGSPAIVIGRKGSIGALFFSPVPCWPIDTTYYIDVFPAHIEPKYIRFFLATLGLERLNRAAAIPGLNREDVHRWDVPLPAVDDPPRSLDMQLRIVARIEALMAEVKRAHELIEQMEYYVSMLTKSVLGAVIEEVDKSCSDPISIGKLISNRQIKLTGGGTPSKNNERYWTGIIPWVSPKDMKRWHINDTQDHISPEALEETIVTLVPKASVLTVVRGMILAHTLPVGITMNEVTINQDMKALTPNGNLSAEYLGYIIRARSQSILQKVEIAAHGTRRLKTETLLDVRVPELPMNSQKRIVEYLNAVELDVEQMHRLLRKDSDLLDQIEQSILERAFRGEL